MLRKMCCLASKLPQCRVAGRSPIAPVSRVCHLPQTSTSRTLIRAKGIDKVVSRTRPRVKILPVQDPPIRM